ncbi:hypothetical protein ISCGN_011545 [Ixodes scapularis]
MAPLRRPPPLLALPLSLPHPNASSSPRPKGGTGVAGATPTPCPLSRVRARSAPNMASPDAATGALLPENLSVSGVVLPPPPPYLSASDSRGSSSPSTHDLPPPLPPAFNAAALCDQFCSVINGFRGLDPLSNARLKSPSSRSVAADATDCRLIQYRGEKIAAFAYRGEYLLCLPQAFELFLRHLVGGLHTVYTKLKRLGISPIVCNVEQVRVLRGLGAIQPGVNRCKLLSCKDFDALYKDCTTAR